MNFSNIIKLMEEEIKKICIKLKNILRNLDENQRYIIGVGGIPGSGKTTFVNNLVKDFNKKNKENVIIAISMDGFHIPKSILNTFYNKEEAYIRRGVYWTFDVNGIINFLNLLKKPLDSTKTIKVPSFDHKIADPIKDDINIETFHKIIIIEGIYLQLSNPEPWNQIPLLLDEKWFIPIDIEEARDRVSKRHYYSGITKSIEDGITRFNNNDMLNAKFILENLENKDKNIKYIYINNKNKN